MCQEFEKRRGREQLQGWWDGVAVAKRDSDFREKGKEKLRVIHWQLKSQGWRPQSPPGTQKELPPSLTARSPGEKAKDGVQGKASAAELQGWTRDLGRSASRGQARQDHRLPQPPPACSPSTEQCRSDKRGKKPYPEAAAGLLPPKPGEPGSRRVRPWNRIRESWLAREPSPRVWDWTPQQVPWGWCRHTSWMTPRSRKPARQSDRVRQREKGGEAGRRTGWGGHAAWRRPGVCLFRGGPGAHVLSEGPQPGQGVLRLPRRPAGGDAVTVTARGCRAHGDGSETGGGRRVLVRRVTEMVTGSWKPWLSLRGWKKSRTGDQQLTLCSSSNWPGLLCLSQS